MADTQPELKRSLGLFEVTVSGVGVILGAGIYALLGQGTALAGNAVWLAFLLSALMAVFTGLSYAELAAAFPRAGAEYEYVNRAFGQGAGFIIGWLVIMSGVFAAATVALGFAGISPS
jgi:APA family basic amino acid/polyamine antiporter